MKIVEIRDLDGPNLFDLRPVIKLEVEVEPDEHLPESSRHLLGPVVSGTSTPEPVRALHGAIRELHDLAGLPQPETRERALDLPNHYAVSFSWEWRSTATMIAQAAFDRVQRGQFTDGIADLMANALERDRERDDRPEWIRDSQRSIPTVAVTGTNGKTTTCRLLFYIARRAGYRVGMSGSAGVYIDDEQVLEGDYSGPSGARRVLLDSSVTLAVLESARGGILLRGLGYESNDIGVMLNISPDHLSLQGVERLETLAEVKSVVLQVTRPDGVAVLNADDPLVLAQRERTRANVVLISQQPDNPALAEHVAANGKAVVCDDRFIVLWDGGISQRIADLRDVPSTFAGTARHMVENTLTAAAAAHFGLGLDLDVVVESLASFRSDSRLNTGRLNIFRLDGRVVIVDYAHNESGLEMLLNFARGIMPSAHISAVIGTAGDRQDSILRGIGRIAGQLADHIYVKENPKYLRGRTQEQINELVMTGIGEARAESRVVGIYPTEYDATFAAIADASPDNVVAVMCVEDQRRILDELDQRGAHEWYPKV
jgi:cyanophycin synthetase